MVRAPAAWIVAVSLMAACAHAQPIEPTPAELLAPEPDATVGSLDDSDTPPTPNEALPRGRAIAELTSETCLALLTQEGVAFDPPDVALDTSAIQTPIVLRGPLGGVTIENRGHVALHSVLDCRLAVAILAWAPALRARGVAKILHFSTFRPGARIRSSGRASGHSRGLALDAGVFVLDDGSEHDVLTAWVARTRGDPPCDRYDEPESSATLRAAVCDAVAADLFQVVITPHHDRAHQNHVHLEVVRGVQWSFIR